MPSLFQTQDHGRQRAPPSYAKARTWCAAVRVPGAGLFVKGELGFYRKDEWTDHLRIRHGRGIPKR